MLAEFLMKTGPGAVVVFVFSCLFLGGLAVGITKSLESQRGLALPAFILCFFMAIVSGIFMVASAIAIVLGAIQWIGSLT